MSWKNGPMPPGTYGWGGVVPLIPASTTGFFFADFRGDHVLLCPGGRRVEANEVVEYDNSLELPPRPKGAAGDTVAEPGRVGGY